MKIKENKTAPNFKLPSTDGNIFELNKNKKILFYTSIQKMILPVVPWVS